MDLNFSTTINDKPTYFVEKILNGLFQNQILTLKEEVHTREQYFRHTKKPLPKLIPHRAKIHTIRADNGNRWAAGKDIHFVTGARTPQRWNFAPLVKVVSTQNIVIHPIASEENGVWIDDKKLTNEQVQNLAIRDSFDNVQEFWDFFAEPFEGKIIHWTKMKY